MRAKPKPIEGPRPIAVADAHAIADRIERSKFFGPYTDISIAVLLIRALLRGRKASDIIDVDY